MSSIGQPRKQRGSEDGEQCAEQPAVTLERGQTSRARHEGHGRQQRHGGGNEQQPEVRVWFDKDDLRAGEPWQAQIEDAIRRSSAFAVYVGSKGIANWVDAEVRV